jgi:UDP-N-acetylglucosamine 2-epimerase (non-hydrolysing)
MQIREAKREDMLKITEEIKLAIMNMPSLTFLHIKHSNPKSNLMSQKLEAEQNSNILLLEQLPYHELIFLLIHSDIIMTDSGGLQEEGISLNKKVLCLRNKTERAEGLNCGLYLEPDAQNFNLTNVLKKIFSDISINHGSAQNTFGDGKASERIVKILAIELETYLKQKDLKCL